MMIDVIKLDDGGRKGKTEGEGTEDCRLDYHCNETLQELGRLTVNSKMHFD